MFRCKKKYIQLTAVIAVITCNWVLWKTTCSGSLQSKLDYSRFPALPLHFHCKGLQCRMDFILANLAQWSFWYWYCQDTHRFYMLKLHFFDSTFDMNWIFTPNTTGLIILTKPISEWPLGQATSSGSKNFWNPSILGLFRLFEKSKQNLTRRDYFCKSEGLSKKVYSMPF